MLVVIFQDAALGRAEVCAVNPYFFIYHIGSSLCHHPRHHRRHHRRHHPRHHRRHHPRLQPY